MLQGVNDPEDNIGADTYYRNIDQSVDIPAEPLGKLFENDQRGISRTDKKHIHMFVQSKLYKAVKEKRDDTKTDKCPCSTPVICNTGSTPA